MMRWTKITVHTTVQAVDLLSAFLYEEGVLGVEIEDNVPLTEAEKQEMFIDLLPDEIKPDDGSARLSFFADDGYDIEEIIAKVSAELSRLSEYVDTGACVITTETSREEEWIDNWKKYFKPFRLYDDIVIKPTWDDSVEAHKDDIVINIDPGTAFGTGSHETTRLCIGQIKKYMKPGDMVLDAGSGSGILSFICARLGASHVHGIDIDANAVRVSNENRDINNIPASLVDFECGNILQDKKLVKRLGKRYNIVVANILADVIIPLTGIVRDIMTQDGIFIASGIINTKEDEVKKALLEGGFEIIDTVYMKDWVSFTAK